VILRGLNKAQKKEIYFYKAKIFSSFLLILMHVFHHAKYRSLKEAFDCGLKYASAIFVTYNRGARVFYCLKTRKKVPLLAKFGTFKIFEHFLSHFGPILDKHFGHFPES